MPFHDTVLSSVKLTTFLLNILSNNLAFFNSLLIEDETFSVLNKRNKIY